MAWPGPGQAWGWPGNGLARPGNGLPWPGLAWVKVTPPGGRLLMSNPNILTPMSLVGGYVLGLATRLGLG